MTHIFGPQQITHMKNLHALIVFFLATGAAFAQQEKGDMQIQAQGAYYNIAGSDNGTIFLNVSRFITNNVEIGISPVITFTPVTTSVNLALFGKYSFLTPDAKLVPYVGAGVSIFNLGEDFASTGFTISGGTRYFLTEKVNIDLSANMAFTEGTSSFIVLAGLGYIFSWD